MLGKREAVVYRLATLKTLPAYQQLPRQSAAASGALGSLPLHALGSLGPFPFVRYPRWQESTFWSRVAVRKLSLWVASLGDMSQPPASLGRFLGRRPFSTVHHCTGQVATDPRSPKGGSQRACPLGAPTPRLLGVAKECKAVGPALAVKVREF